MNDNYDFFMKLDVTPYIGQWVGLCENRVVSHSTSFREVYEETKKVCGSKKPFVAIVPSNEIMIL